MLVLVGLMIFIIFLCLGNFVGKLFGDLRTFQTVSESKKHPKIKSEIAFLIEFVGSCLLIYKIYIPSHTFL